MTVSVAFNANELMIFPHDAPYYVVARQGSQVQSNHFALDFIPAKTVREKVQCDRGTAYIAVGALEHVISDLRKNL